MTIDQARDKARSKALETGKNYSVVRMESLQENFDMPLEICVVLTEYTYLDEFAAFCGEVIADFDAAGEEIY